MLRQEHEERFVISSLLNKHTYTENQLQVTLDGHECSKKIKLFPKIKHELILVGSLLELSEIYDDFW